MKKLVLSLLLLLAAVGLAACWGQEEIVQDPNVLDAQEYTPETVYIGSVLPLSGNDASRGRLLKAAQETAVEIINESHELDWDLAAAAGISGYGASRIELVFADSVGAESASTTAAEAAGDLAKLGVVAVLGAYRSDATAEAAAVAAQAQLPIISGTAAFSSLTDGESYDFEGWFSRVAPTVEMQSELFFAYVKHLNQTQNAGVTKIAVAYLDDNYGQEMLRSFDQRAESYGLQVVGRLAYKRDANATDLAGVAQRMMLNQAQAVFHYGTAAELSYFVNAYSQAQFTPQAAFCYSSIFQTPTFFGAVQKTGADYWCGISAMPDDSLNTDSTTAPLFNVELYEYINAIYRNKAGLDMDNEALYDFAAIIVLAQAMGQAGSTQGELLREALQDTVFPAPYLAAGSIAFNEFGQNTVNTGYVCRLLDDEYQAVFR